MIIDGVGTVQAGREFQMAEKLLRLAGSSRMTLDSGGTVEACRQFESDN